MNNLITIDKAHLDNALHEREALVQINLLKQLVTACETDIEKLEQYLVEHAKAFKNTHSVLSDFVPKKSLKNESLMDEI